MMILPLLMLMSSCAELNDKFDCPAQSGIRCESITSINARVDRGELGVHGINSIENKTMEAIPTYIPHQLNTPHYSSKGEPLRYAETVQRVWVAPFEDKQGNYHQENDIYTVAKPGKWIGAPLKEIDPTGE